MIHSHAKTNLTTCHWIYEEGNKPKGKKSKNDCHIYLNR